jgi:hypothetical protein
MAILITLNTSDITYNIPGAVFIFCNLRMDQKAIIWSSLGLFISYKENEVLWIHYLIPNSVYNVFGLQHSYGSKLT